jgi:hypothetical protein
MVTKTWRTCRLLDRKSNFGLSSGIDLQAYYYSEENPDAGAECLLLFGGIVAFFGILVFTAFIRASIKEYKVKEEQSDHEEGQPPIAAYGGVAYTLDPSREGITYVSLELSV